MPSKRATLSLPASTVRLAPGLYDDIDEVAYHSDCAEEPSLSGSLAKMFFTRSPWHVWHAHPRLNPKWQMDPGKLNTEIGTVCHKLLFGVGREYVALDFDDLRTKDAKAARERALAQGQTPILRKHLDGLIPMAEACHAQLRETEHEGAFAKGRPEVTMVAREPSGVMLRSRLDWLPDKARAGGHVTLYDYKTTERSASPEEWQRILFDKGMDIQAAFYDRVFRQIVPGVRSVEFVFIVQEWKPPYAVSLVSLGGEGLESAHDQVSAAIGTWEACRAANSWPGYPKRTVYVEPANWRKSQVVMRKMQMHDLQAMLNEPVTRFDPETGEITDDRPRDVFGLPALDATSGDGNAGGAPRDAKPAAIGGGGGSILPAAGAKPAVREPEEGGDEDGEL